MTGAEMVFLKNQRIRVDGIEFEVLGGIEFYNAQDGSRWKEYRLKELHSGQERWLSIDHLYEEYAIYTPQAYNDEFSEDQMSRNGYRDADSGKAAVQSCFGSVDAEPGDWVIYQEYEDRTEEYLLSVEEWEDEKEYSKGYYLDAEEILLLEDGHVKTGGEHFSVPGAGKKKSSAAMMAGVGIVILMVTGLLTARLAGNRDSISKILEKNSLFTYQTSITSDLNPDKKADVYATDLTVEETVKLLIREIKGKTEEVQTDENGESVGILTKKEYGLVYQSEEGDTLIQISSRAYAYQSTNRPYRSSVRTYGHYRNFYHTWGFPKDSTAYHKARNGYSGYDGTFLTRDNSDPYRTYSDSIRQSSVSTRRSSGGGISSGK